MSFFFDVWAYDGFVLASDVRLMVNGKPQYSHKIGRTHKNSRIFSAIAVCGEYPDSCLNWFFEATNSKDSLRNIAKHFAEKWTHRFGGTQEYSAAHLVGFEPVPGAAEKVPQMWFWCNWAPDTFYANEKLESDLASFDDPIPSNNHIPWKIKALTGKLPDPTLEDEAKIVLSFLRLYQPFFTWNGDTNFWRSAAEAVGSAMNLLWREKSNWNISEVERVTRYCLSFLGDVATLLPDSSVGFLNNKEFDLIKVTQHGIETVSWANIS
jgi:hypothetical protein